MRGSGVPVTPGSGFRLKPLNWPNMLLFKLDVSVGEVVFSSAEFMSSVLDGVDAGMLCGDEGGPRDDGLVRDFEGELQLV